jgi:hypothetical protein
MSPDLDPNEALTYLAALAMLAMAIVVLRTRPDRPQNRWFVGVLAVEFILSTIGPTIGVLDDPELLYSCAVLFVFALTYLVPMYLGFLSTLDGKASRMLRTPAGRILPWTLPAFGLAVLIVRPAAIVLPPDPNAKDIWPTLAGPLYYVYEMAVLIMVVFALVAVITHWRSRPPGTPARHDATMFLALGTGAVGAVLGLGEHPIVWTIAYFGIPVAKLLLLGLASYGILHAQLFDLNLKIKWTLSRGSALALLALVFSAVKESLEYFLPGESLMASLAGAIAIGILARPAWIAGRRIAERAFPEAEFTEQSLAARRLDVFRASLESVAADGDIAARERRMLETLRTQLAISVDAANEVERNVLAQLQSPAARPSSVPAVTSKS